MSSSSPLPIFMVAGDQSLGFPLRVVGMDDGQVVLIFRFRIMMRIETETNGGVECDCAMIDVLDDYDPRPPKAWWRQVGDEGTKLLYP